MLMVLWKVIFLLCCFWIIKFFIKIYTNLHAPIIQSNGTVLSKRIDKPIHYNDAMKEKAYIHYLVTFELNGKSLELECDEDYYERVEVGQTISFSYRGKDIIQ